MQADGGTVFRGFVPRHPRRAVGVRKGKLLQIDNSNSVAFPPNRFFTLLTTSKTPNTPIARCRRHQRPDRHHAIIRKYPMMMAWWRSGRWVRSFFEEGVKTLVRGHNGYRRSLRGEIGRESGISGQSSGRRLVGDGCDTRAVIVIEVTEVRAGGTGNTSRDCEGVRESRIRFLPGYIRPDSIRLRDTQKN